MEYGLRRLHLIVLFVWIRRNSPRANSVTALLRARCDAASVKTEPKLLPPPRKLRCQIRARVRANFFAAQIHFCDNRVDVGRAFPGTAGERRVPSISRRTGQVHDVRHRPSHPWLRTLGHPYSKRIEPRLVRFPPIALFARTKKVSREPV